MLGTPTTVTGQHDTVMAGLACGAPSARAWPILREGADCFIAISDGSAMATKRLLADGREEGRPIVAGESGG
jgi:diaminopropionate ammonia-lyase